MNYKGVLIDLDNTLYDYAPCNSAGWLAVNKYLVEHTSLDSKYLETIVSDARKYTNSHLVGTAAMHSRILYLNKAIETLKIKKGINLFNKLSKLNDLYWNAYFSEMELSNGVVAYFDTLKNLSIPICIVTDFTLDVQLKKIEQLKIGDYIDFITSSEEIGKEKPTPEMFISSLRKLNLDAFETIMIGDSFEKDIKGAENVGIKGFHLIKSENYSPANNSFTDFNELL